MKLPKLLILGLFSFGLALPLTACDSDDGGDTTSSDSNAETDNDTSGGAEEETTGAEEGGMDVDCSTFCTGYIDLCLQTGNGTEFETFDACNEACAAWDQAGVNCRNEQIAAGACDQAGNMGSAC